MPFRPSCVMCVSDCDANAVLTNCQHFLCVRCVAKYPQGQCPRCQKPCKVIRLSAPNFPRDMMERIQADPVKLTQSLAQTLDFQRRQESLASQRLKELVTALNNSNRSMAAQMQSMQQELAAAKSQVQALEGELRSAQAQQLPFSNHRPPPPPRSPSFFNTSAAAATPTPQHQQPLPWGRVKRTRDDATPTHHHHHHHKNINDISPGPRTPAASDDGGGGSGALFQLATPAITLRNIPTSAAAFAAATPQLLPPSRAGGVCTGLAGASDLRPPLTTENLNRMNTMTAGHTPTQQQQQQPTHSQVPQVPKLRSLLPQTANGHGGGTAKGGERLIHSSSGHHGDPFLN